jgi:hypothetical protein
MDIINFSRRAMFNSAAVALGAASSDRAARVVAGATLNRGFMRHVLQPGLRGMGIGAGLGMGGSLLGGAFSGDMPSFGQTLGAGFRGAFLGGIGGAGFGGIRRIGRGYLAGTPTLEANMRRGTAGRWISDRMGPWGF